VRPCSGGRRPRPTGWGTLYRATSADSRGIPTHGRGRRRVAVDRCRIDPALGTDGPHGPSNLAPTGARGERTADMGQRGDARPVREHAPRRRAPPGVLAERVRRRRHRGARCGSRARKHRPSPQMRRSERVAANTPSPRRTRTAGLVPNRSWHGTSGVTRSDPAASRGKPQHVRRPAPVALHQRATCDTPRGIIRATSRISAGLHRGSRAPEGAGRRPAAPRAVPQAGARSNTARMVIPVMRNAPGTSSRGPGAFFMSACTVPHER
jgi:hypothetical protein